MRDCVTGGRGVDKGTRVVRLIADMSESEEELGGERVGGLSVVSNSRWRS
jgi:hypothetical protein